MTVYRWRMYSAEKNIVRKMDELDDSLIPTTRRGRACRFTLRLTPNHEKVYLTKYDAIDGRIYCAGEFNGQDFNASLTRIDSFICKVNYEMGDHSRDDRVSFESVSENDVDEKYYEVKNQGPGGEFDPVDSTVFTLWRVYHFHIDTEYKAGIFLRKVTSTNRNAFPNNGEQFGNWYVYDGIANQEPTISGQDENLGGFKAPFKRVFSVDDPDSNETLNVVVKLNSATIRTINNATKNESYEIDIDKTKFDGLELNKTNTIEITVTDTNGASAIRRYTFKKVNSNPVVTVTNSNLGEQNKPFNFSFKAKDPDGDDISVKVYVDDVQVQDLGKVTPDQVKTVGIGKLDYAKLLNGEHRIKIEATDSFGAKGTGYITFTKKIDYCWYRLTKEVDAQPSAVVVNPLAELAKGAKMTVKVSLNAKDTDPTWEVLPDDFIGQKYNFKTKTKTADKWCIGVDIRIDRANTPEGMASYFYGFVGAYM